MNALCFLALAFAALAASTASHSAEIRSAADGGIVYDAGVDGLEIEFETHGGVTRVSSTWRQPVIIPDRPGIAKAQIIAEEKAKAAIVRYMNQVASNERLVTEIAEDVATTAAKTGSGEVQMSTEASRNMTNSLKETTRSFAAGRLRGVIVLDRGFNSKTGEAWVTVGMSEKSMNTAARLAESIKAASGDTLAAPAAAGAKKPAASGTSTREGALLPQAAEAHHVRKVPW